MCGRYTIRRMELLAAALAAVPTFDVGQPRFNIAPSQDVPVVRLDRNGNRTLSQLRWGLIPHWSKGKPKQQPINARSESVATNPVFRGAFERHRCLVAADGFYEWQGAKPPKQPWFFRLKDDAPFAFAGLWERWSPGDDSPPLDTTCHLTTVPNELMAPVHNRQPLILHARDYDRWLDPKVSGQDVADLLVPYPANLMQAYRVSSQVNNVRHEGPELVEPEPSVTDLRDRG